MLEISQESRFNTKPKLDLQNISHLKAPSMLTFDSKMLLSRNYNANDKSVLLPSVQGIFKSRQKQSYLKRTEELRVSDRSD